MTWTETVPTTPGLYWVLREGQGPTVVRLRRVEGPGEPKGLWEVTRLGDERTDYLWADGREWDWARHLKGEATRPTGWRWWPAEVVPPPVPVAAVTA
jgi:hypothetical protein